MNIEHISTGAILSAMMLAPSNFNSEPLRHVDYEPYQEVGPFWSPPVLSLTANEARALLMRREYTDQSSTSSFALSISDANAVSIPEDASSLVAEMRRLSGLTWAQIAEVFSVSKRAPYHWASGKNVSPDNHQRLGEVVALLRSVDRGSADENRNLLLGATGAGGTPLDLLREGRDDEFRELIGNGVGRLALRDTLSADSSSQVAPQHWGELASEVGHEIVEVQVSKPSLRRAKPSRRKA